MASESKELEGVDQVLEGEASDVDWSELLKKAHPDHGGSKEELQRVLGLREKHRESQEPGGINGFKEDLLDSLEGVYSRFTAFNPSFGFDIDFDFFSNGSGEASEGSKDAVLGSLPEPDYDPELEQEYQTLLGVDGLSEEHAQEALNYGGNSSMARQILEAEWKIVNAEEYLDWDNFSEGSLTGEAELILSEFSRSDREEMINSMIEESDQYGEITKTWTQHGNLMGYSTSEGHPVKLIDSYEDLEDRVDARSQSLGDIIRENKRDIDEYGKAAVNSIVNPEIEGDIEDDKLISYIENKIN